MQSVRKFIPPHTKANVAEIKKFGEELFKHEKLYVITGAGLSTESGVPDYRSEVVGLYARSNHRPLQHSDFIRSEKARKKYWARNFAGWKNFSSLEPNLSHKILREWERSGRLHWLVTQNVDGLHRKAGSTLFTELHGCMYEVECLRCGKLYDRHSIQKKLDSENPHFNEKEVLSISPDGDVFIPDEKVVDFVAPLCSCCRFGGGVLKPRVVFFGDNVKKDIVELTKSKLSQSDAVLTIGTSIQTYSCYRLILQAKKEGKPVYIMNIGPTRADHLAAMKIESLASFVLSHISPPSLSSLSSPQQHSNISVS